MFIIIAGMDKTIIRHSTTTVIGTTMIMSSTIVMTAVSTRATIMMTLIVGLHQCPIFKWVSVTISEDDRGQTKTNSSSIVKTNPPFGEKTTVNK